MKKGFTLIELLVVVSIIALLLAVILPGLRKAKDAARRTICLSNIKSQTLSWNLYANDNGGKIAAAKTTPIYETSSNPRTFDWHPGYLKNWGPTWVGMIHPTASFGLQTTDAKAQLACVTMGTFYPYSGQSPDIYRCPEDREDWQACSYSPVDAMDGANPPYFENKGKIYKKTTEIRHAATMLVFVCVGTNASNQSWTVCPNKVEWWDKPPVRHPYLGDTSTFRQSGTTVSFVDGHAEYWKWQDRRTVEFALGISKDRAATAQNNEDFTKLQMAIWGGLKR